MQPSLPTPIPEAAEIARKLSWPGALELCAEAAGYCLDKQASAELGMDKARWSRIKAGQEGIKWEQLKAFMEAMGNPVPVLWMLHQCGFDLHSVRRRETETERELRQAREALEAERAKVRILTSALRGNA